MKDREIAYEQNVVGLEIAWRDRIEARARLAADGKGWYFKREAATDAVEKMLFGSAQWENVAAADVSDIVEEAVDRVFDSGDFETAEPKHPKYHSTHADLWDQRESK